MRCASPARLVLTTAVVVALAALPACGSDDAGGAGPENGGACIESVFVLSSGDAQTALGFSVDDVLTRATDPRTR